MLGSQAIAYLHRFGEVPGENECAALFQAGADDVGPVHLRQQAVDAGLHPVQVGGVRAQQQGLGLLVVLGLGKQVHCNPVRVGAAVADDQDFGGPGDHVYAHPAEHLALGSGYVDIARPGDLVHRRYGGGAVGQRGDGLGATDGEHPVHAGDPRGRQHQLAQLAARGGDHHDYFAHTRDPGRQRIHQH